MKKTIIIAQKKSGGGDIYALASEHYERRISMGEKYQFAVVLPSFYGDCVTRHLTEAAAAAADQKNTRLGYKGVAVIDRSGGLCVFGPEGDIVSSEELSGVTVV